MTKSGANPYSSVPISKWGATTQKLITTYPLKMQDLAQVVQDSWRDIFESRIGKKGYRFGREITPQPQIMGFLLHELIPVVLADLYPKSWRRGEASSEPDAVNIRNPAYSFEIKTSSSKGGVFGNRSYAHLSATAGKRRGNYFLVVNFEKFTEVGMRPNLTLIRFGWLDGSDWIGQNAESGQQSRLTKEAKAYKLAVIWEPRAQ